MDKLQYLLLFFFIACYAYTKDIDEYLQIKKAIGRRLEFKISGNYLKSVLKKGISMLGKEKSKYFKNKLGENNFSYFLFTCRRLPLIGYELEADPRTIMIITNIRASFGQSTCMTKDIYQTSAF